MSQPRYLDADQVRAQDAALEALEHSTTSAVLADIAAYWLGDGLPYCPTHLALSYRSLEAGRCLRCVPTAPEEMLL